MRKIMTIALIALCVNAGAQLHPSYKTVNVRDSIRLGSVWRSSWPGGSGSVFANSGLYKDGDTIKLFDTDSTFNLYVSSYNLSQVAGIGVDRSQWLHLISNTNINISSPNVDCGIYDANENFGIRTRTFSVSGKKIGTPYYDFMLNVDSSGVTLYKLNKGMIAKIDSVGNIYTNVAFTVINGSSSGVITWTEPFRGTTYKKVVVMFSSMSGAGTSITYPIAFVHAPYIYGTTAAIAVCSSNTTTLTIAPTAGVTGFVFIEGY